MNTLSKASNLSPRILRMLLNLLNGWQLHNCMGPLRHLLRKWPPFTDNRHDYRELLYSLRSVRSQAKHALTPRELTRVDKKTLDSLIHWLERRVA